LLAVEAGDAGDGGDHHARKELHGSHVAFVEGSGGGGKDLEDSEGAAVMA